MGYTNNQKQTVISKEPSAAIFIHQLARLIKEDIWEITPIEIVKGEYIFTVTKLGDSEAKKEWVNDYKAAYEELSEALTGMASVDTGDDALDCVIDQDVSTMTDKMNLWMHKSELADDREAREERS